MIELDLYLHAETGRAWLVSEDGDRDSGVWLPKSQCIELRRVLGPRNEPDEIVIDVPEWLCREKDLL